MMKLNALLAIILMLTSCSGNMPASADSLEEMVTALASEFPGMSITVLKGDETVYAKSFGVEDYETGKLVSADTRFNIYSVSKLITGMAFMRLIHKDMVSLNTPIIEISPSLPSTYANITLHQLLTHISGIRHYKGRKDWIQFAAQTCATPLDAISYFGDDALKSEPGQKKRYSTFGYVVASQVLMDLTGTANFDAALSSALGFDPIFRVDSVTAEKATPYVKQSGNYVSMSPASAECKFGGGGILSNSGALAEFGSAIYNGQIVHTKEMRALMFEGNATADESYAYGAAFGVTETAKGGDVLYMTVGGGGAGGRGYLVVLVDPKIAVSITANAEGDGDAVAEVAISLAQHFLDEDGL